jgi:serine/threonine-protein kinase
MVGEGRNWAGIWTDDGERIVFLVSEHEPGGLYWRRADGTGDAEPLIDARAPEGVYGHGSTLAFITLTGNRDYGISMLDLATRAVTPIVDRPGSEQHSSRLSPDGRWIAYASSETGRQEVWLEPMPRNGKRYRVTQEGGSHPLWSPDGRTVYFDRDHRLFRIPMFFGAEEPKAGAPKALPIRDFLQGDLRRQYDLLPDGRHFLMLYPAQ